MPFWDLLQPFDGLWWGLAGLVPLLYLQRRLHGELITVFFLLTRSEKIAIMLYALLFFPGVFLHEMSHLVSAMLLGVRTGKVWLLPERLPDGNLALGYVQTAETDFFRGSLIGFAPMLFGGIFVGYAGLNQLKFNQLWESVLNVQWEKLPETVTVLYQQSDFWLWFYLVFVVSATMVPSPSDRHAWRTLILSSVTLVVLALGVGAGPWMLENIVPPINKVLRSAAVVFAISNLVHLALLFPMVLLRRGLSGLKG